MVRALLRPAIPVRLLLSSTILPAIVAGFLAFAQPGLCPCWMLDHVHPHPFSHAELPHRHDYLFWFYASDPAETPPAIPSRSELHARFFALGDLWAVGSDLLPGAPVWSPSPSPPPPRLLLPV
jgi:hypothetical protein